MRDQSQQHDDVFIPQFYFVHECADKTIDEQFHSKKSDEKICDIPHPNQFAIF